MFSHDLKIDTQDGVLEVATSVDKVGFVSTTSDESCNMVE